MKVFYIGSALILASVFSVGQLQYFVDSVVKVGAKTYFVNSLFKANYYVASEFCRYNGLQLASFENLDQLDAVANYIKSLKLTAPEQFWTSGTDLGHEGRYVWMATGSPFNISAWNDTQPDNDKGIENCVEINSSLALNDRSCDVESFFICQFIEDSCRPFQNICDLIPKIIAE